MADTLNILSLFTGSGMHDEAVRAGLRVLGYNSRVCGYVEREASAAAFLMGRMEAATVEPAPVFVGDLRDVDARPMRGHVDIVVASPPCQPYSSAGQRRGESDERSFGDDGAGPLGHTIRIIDECRPALVWFENVPEWVTGGTFRRFGDELSRLGYSVQDPIFLAAEDVGAPHRRERVFILAVADAERDARRQSEPRRRSNWRAPAGRTGGALADRDDELDHAASPRRDGSGTWSDSIGEGGQCVLEERGPKLAERPSRGCRVGGQPSAGDGLADRSDVQLGYAGSPRRKGAERRGASDFARATARGSTGQSVGDVPLFPPGRDDYRRWAALAAGGLDPALMPCVERGLPALAHGLAISNSDLLRLGGNGIVPLCASLAFAVATRGYLWDENGLRPPLRRASDAGQK